MATWKKRPNDAIVFKFDFAPLTNGQQDAESDWLASGQTLASVTSVTIDSGATVDTYALTDSNTAVNAKLSSGTNGTSYTVTCLCVTSDSQTVEATKELLVTTSIRDG